jgi:hypothetical protein
MADYLDWRDLLDEEEAATTGAAPPQGTDAPAEADEPALTQALPADLQALMAEKARLEDELRALSGQAKPGTSPEDLRRERCFPVKVHTKESRIEERRLRRHDEQLRLLAQRAGERAAGERRAEQQRAAEAALRRREWLQRRIVALAAAEAAERAAAELRARAAAEAAVRAAAEAASRERWAAQRREAVASRTAEARRASAWNEARHDVQLAATAARCQAREREQEMAAARAEQARAGRVAAAAELVQARRREARAIDRHLDERNRRQ